MKRKLIASCTGVLVAVLLAVPARVGATPNPPLNTYKEFQYGNCLVGFMHGNFNTAAYAKFSLAYPAAFGFCYEHTRVTAFGIRGVQTFSATCMMSGCTAGAGGWYQATVPNTVLIRTELTLCRDTGGCKTFNLSGI
ncbi:MAG TPA: hypothetical protein VK694_05420 [Verrucomicrobiae bacterium]|nr:hypothetical protein [Verrucomicrobiae bacterium]